MRSLTEMVGKEIERDDVRRAALGDDAFPDLYQAMLRRTGHPFGTPRAMFPHQAEEMANRLRTLVWYNTRTGEVLYSREQPYSDAPSNVKR